MLDYLQQEKAIDWKLNLTKLAMDNKVTLGDFQCPNDGHFCNEGNAWIAQQIDEHLVRQERQR
jgi:hypothetical protein